MASGMQITIGQTVRLLWQAAEHAHSGRRWICEGAFWSPLSFRCPEVVAGASAGLSLLACRCRNGCHISFDCDRQIDPPQPAFPMPSKSPQAPSRGCPHSSAGGGHRLGTEISRSAIPAFYSFYPLGTRPLADALCRSPNPLIPLPCVACAARGAIHSPKPAIGPVPGPLVPSGPGGAVQANACGEISLQPAKGPSTFRGARSARYLEIHRCRLLLLLIP